MALERQMHQQCAPWSSIHADRQRATLFTAAFRIPVERLHP